MSFLRAVHTEMQKCISRGFILACFVLCGLGFSGVGLVGVFF